MKITRRGKKCQYTEYYTRETHTWRPKCMRSPSHIAKWQNARMHLCVLVRRAQGHKTSQLRHGGVVSVRRCAARAFGIFSLIVVVTKVQKGPMTVWGKPIACHSSVGPAVQKESRSAFIHVQIKTRALVYDSVGLGWSTSRACHASQNFLLALLPQQSGALCRNDHGLERT